MVRFVRSHPSRANTLSALRSSARADRISALCGLLGGTCLLVGALARASTSSSSSSSPSTSTQSEMLSSAATMSAGFFLTAANVRDIAHATIHASMTARAAGPTLAAIAAVALAIGSLSLTNAGLLALFHRDRAARAQRAIAAVLLSTGCAANAAGGGTTTTRSDVDGARALTAFVTSVAAGLLALAAALALGEAARPLAVSVDVAAGGAATAAGALGIWHGNTLQIWRAELFDREFVSALVEEGEQTSDSGDDDRDGADAERNDALVRTERNTERTRWMVVRVGAGIVARARRVIWGAPIQPAPRPASPSPPSSPSSPGTRSSRGDNDGSQWSSPSSSCRSSVSSRSTSPSSAGSHVGPGDGGRKDDGGAGTGSFKTKRDCRVAMVTSSGRGAGGDRDAVLRASRDSAKKGGGIRIGTGRGGGDGNAGDEAQGTSKSSVHWAR